MANKHIAIYLNDHLAGSVAALELLEHLESAHAGTPLERFFVELRGEISADRQELQALMSGLSIGESPARKVSGWLTEKFTELKLRLDDPAGGPLHLFEALEGLSLGIEGKRSLWLALAAAAEDSPTLRLVDFTRLTRRAEEQRNGVETVRLEAAKKALVPDHS